MLLFSLHAGGQSSQYSKSKSKSKQKKEMESYGVGGGSGGGGGGGDEAVSLEILSLRTLGAFNFRGGTAPLLPYLRSTVMPFLDHANESVRKSAALTCSRLLFPPTELLRKRGRVR